MSAADRLNEIEARAKDADRAGVFESNHPTWAAWEAAWDSSTDVPALVAALRAVLEEIDKRKGTVGGRLTLADVLPLRIEEALS